MVGTKQFIIDKQLVVRAYKLVKANAGIGGVDEQSLEDFGKNWKDNLYKIWNRMSSGSYMPPAVKSIAIPKKNKGVRILGVPTVSDRIAQMVVKLTLEPFVEPIFHKDSYGYRPNKSAIDAIGITRTRCWKYDFVVEFDIKGMFDNIDHDFLMKAVRKHTDNKWVILYIERWLKAPMQASDGTISVRNKGTPQGGVISPLLCNLFLHYVFDVWMDKYHPEVPHCRYADDGLVHCKSEKEAKFMLQSLSNRFEECELELHPDKTRIVYCKDVNRKGQYANTSFDFLGFTFKRRVSHNKENGQLFMNFTPGVSKASIKSMRAEVRKSGLRNRTELSLEEIARWWNPIIRGWIGYYGSYNKWAMYPVLRHFNLTLVDWTKNKYKKFKRSKLKASQFMISIANRTMGLFAHWKLGMVGTFV